MPKPTNLTKYGEYGPFDAWTDQHGRLVITFAEDFGKEKIQLFREEFEYMREEHGLGMAESEAFESFYTQGLEYFDADEMGALSNAPCLGDLSYFPGWVCQLIEKDYWKRWNSGELCPISPNMLQVDWDNSRVWAYTPYAVRSPVDDLLDGGFVIFDKVEVSNE